jgi:hypothetical protein
MVITLREVTRMNDAPGQLGHESAVLLRRLDGHLAGLRLERDPVEYTLAERVAGALRRLVAETAFASAADRALVRAAVHYFVLRPGRGDRRTVRPMSEDVRVVNEILRTLDRPDLTISLTWEPA